MYVFRSLMALLLLLVFLPLGAEASPKHNKKKPAEAPADDLLAAPAGAAPAGVVPAVEPGQKVDSEAIKAALAAYDDLDYARCVSELQKALGESLTRDEKLVTYRTLAFCHVGLDKPDAAKFDFENLLRIDESYELDRRISPRIRAPFEEAKAAVATGESVEGQANEIQFKTPSVDTEVMPHKAGEGKAITVSAQFAARGATKAELFYRVRGQAVFNKLSTPGSPDGKFSFTVPGMQVQPPAVDYYLNLLDDSNTVVAHAGVLSQPLSVPVTAQKRPVYVKGWFWGVVVGAVAVAAAVVGGTVAATTGGSGVSKNSSASVTVVPR
jgi:hypothetical protein